MQKLIEAFFESLGEAMMAAMIVIVLCAAVGVILGTTIGVARDKIEGTPGQYERQYANHGRDIGLNVGFVASEFIGRPRPRMARARVANKVLPRASTYGASPPPQTQSTKREHEPTPLEEAGSSLLQSYVIDHIHGTVRVGFRSEQFGLADPQIGEIRKVTCPVAWRSYENVPAFEAFRLPSFREAYKHAIAQLPREVWELHKRWLTFIHAQSSPSACIQTQIGTYVLFESSEPYGSAGLLAIFDPDSHSLTVRFFDGFVYRVVGSSARSLRALASSEALMQWQARG